MSRNPFYIASAVDPKDYPSSGVPEVAMTGRSNAGKSSLVNSLIGSQAAHVSKTPGKTRILNFFQMNKYRLVDMPGYGFASRSQDEMFQYRDMIEDYFSIRADACTLVLVTDVRREWSADEELLVQFARRMDKDLIIAATKIDKLNNKELAAALKNLKNSSRVEKIFPISSLKKLGIKELEEAMFQSINTFHYKWSLSKKNQSEDSQHD